MRRAVLHDCDNACGAPARDVDDALALLFLLSQPSVELRGVTACFGNAGLPTVLRATRRLLDRAGRCDLPVLAGAARPGPGASEAARHLVEATAREPGRLTILATGPLTNLAAAAELDPGFPGRCAEIVCLGGSLGPARHGWRRLRELNFEADPEAARRVLALRDAPVTVVPATSCLGLALRRPDLDRMPPALRPALRRWLLCCRLGRGLDHMVAWDAVAALAITHPSLVAVGRATVSLHERGLVSAEPGGRHGLVLGLRDPEAARETLLAGLSTVLPPVSHQAR